MKSAIISWDGIYDIEILREKKLRIGGLPGSCMSQCAAETSITHPYDVECWNRQARANSVDIYRTAPSDLDQSAPDLGLL